MEQDKMRLDTMCFELGTKNAALQQQLAASSGSAAENQTMLNNLRQQHQEELAKEQQVSGTRESVPCSLGRPVTVWRSKIYPARDLSCATPLT